MSGLVARLQRDSLDQSVSVASLLRSVKLAAIKLKLPRVENWVELELQGYRNGGKCPSYRYVGGQPKAFNPYRGWIPIVGDAAVMKRISEMPTFQSIPELESLLRNDSGSSYRMHYAPEEVNRLNAGSEVRFEQMALFVDRAALVRIVETVRDKVLDWAIALEKNGIVGEGIEFSKEEKQRAHEGPMTVNIGSIGSMVGNVGAGNTTGNINTGDINVQAANSILSQVRKYEAELKSAGVDSAAFERDVARVAEVIAAKDVDPTEVRSAFSDLRNTLSGAAGNLIATGAIEAIKALLGS